MRPTLAALGLALAALAASAPPPVPRDDARAFVAVPPLHGVARSTHTHTHTPTPTHARAEKLPRAPPWHNNATRPRPPPADDDTAAPAARRDRHERMLVELFSALLQADDVALLEREAHGMGFVYLDSNFSMFRAPLLLRNSVRELMHRYDLPMIPVERKWNPVPGNHTVRQDPQTDFYKE